MGRLASPHDTDDVGHAVSSDRTQKSQKKTPALTLPQVRVALARLLALRREPTREDLVKIETDITAQLQRNEQSRVDHWKARHRVLPPPRTAAVGPWE
jgi:hypothetical protein